MIKPEVPEARETADLLNELILKSQEILKDHPVNLKRMAAGKDPANSIWPWSPGYRPAMRTMREMYGFGKGSVISAVDPHPGNRRLRRPRGASRRGSYRIIRHELRGKSARRP